MLPARLAAATAVPMSWAGRASLLLVVAIGLGWVVYAFTLRHGRLRACPTYIGGERMEEPRIPGVPEGAQRHVEVTGVDFFRTVEEIPGLKPLYELARRKVFDLYETGGRAATWVSHKLSGVHTGLLPLYLYWFGLGLLAILWVMLGTDS